MVYVGKYTVRPMDAMGIFVSEFSGQIPLRKLSSQNTLHRFGSWRGLPPKHIRWVRIF